MRIGAALLLLPLAACVVRGQVGELAPNPGPLPSWSGAPLDLLFVIDNSGSMIEEQQRLVDAFSSSGDVAGLCNHDSFVELRSYLKDHPGLPLAEWEDPYPQVIRACGLSELFELFQVRFHIGVISTDLHDCDSPGGDASRGSVPQRGCLQTGTRWPDQPVLSWEHDRQAERFADLIDNLGSWGSAWEQGLAAARTFLTPGHASPAPGRCALARDCAGDLAAFWRDQDLDPRGQVHDVPLLVVFLSDEDDCSHEGAIDENEIGSTGYCYSRPELLTPVTRDVAAITALKPDPTLVALGSIGGFDLDGQAVACTLDGATPRYSCDPAHGNSSAVCSDCNSAGQPYCACHPAIAAAACAGTAHPATDCCQADAATRYQQAVAAAPRGLDAEHLRRRVPLGAQPHPARHRGRSAAALKKN